MKGKKVGKKVELLWPDLATMSDILLLSQNSSPAESPDETSPLSESILYPDTSATDLLWPAHLINEQARLARRRNISQPIAILAFVLSLILGFIIGPVQLILIAAFLDYGWVNATFAIVIHYCLIASAVVCLLCILAAALSFHSTAKPTALTIALIASTLAELTFIWLSSTLLPLKAHEFTITYLVLTAISILIMLFVSKQYFKSTHLTTPLKAVLSALIIFSVLVAGFTGSYLVSYAEQTNPARLERLAEEQLASRTEGVPAMLSDFTHELCSGRYNIIFMATSRPSGLFECVKNGDIYSVSDPDERNFNSARAAATYLGTTRNPDISSVFPDTKYLYRTMPSTLTEDELALMAVASNEDELLDIITPEVLYYWQSHSTANLYLNIFYTPSLETVASTRDFILMSALGTMALVDQLPGGNTRQGYLDGKIITYLYRADRELTALNELGADPELYSASARDALTLHRHISVHLSAGESFDEYTLRTKLSESFTGGVK